MSAMELLKDVSFVEWTVVMDKKQTERRPNRVSSFRDLPWRTKDGRELRIRDMADTHVLNSVAFYRKKVLKATDEHYPKRLKDMDPDARALYAHRVLYTHNEMYMRVYKEAVVRGLIIDTKCLMTEIKSKDLAYTVEPPAPKTKPIMDMMEFMRGDDDAPDV